jgi:uncharacterized membrane protein YjfL (UPF0719 family)
MGTKAGFRFPLGIIEIILFTVIYREVTLYKEPPR